MPHTFVGVCPPAGKRESPSLFETELELQDINRKDESRKRLQFDDINDYKQLELSSHLMQEKERSDGTRILQTEPTDCG